LKGKIYKLRLYFKKETTEISFPFDIEKDTADGVMLELSGCINLTTELIAIMQSKIEES
jgi:hypothetical protein